MDKPLRIFSFGGGVQSHAVLFLQGEGKLPEPYDVFLFCNVGHDSENPETLRYIDDVARPYCEAHGIQLIELRRVKRGQGEVTLYQEALAAKRSMILPVHFPGKGFGNRNCTVDFKIRVVDRWVRQQKIERAVIGMGISVDEWTRVRSMDWSNRENDGENSKPLGFWKKREYPLIDLRMSRQDCHNMIMRLGFNVPPKSSCFFCPFNKPDEWRVLKQTKPELWQRAVDLENALQGKRTEAGRDGGYLHTYARPLEQAVDDQMMLPGVDDSCDSGYCWT